MESRAARYSNSPPVYYIPFAIAPLRYIPASNATHTRAYARTFHAIYTGAPLFIELSLETLARLCVPRFLKFNTPILYALIPNWSRFFLFRSSVRTQPRSKYLQSARQLEQFEIPRVLSPEFSSRNSIDTLLTRFFSSRVISEENEKQNSPLELWSL